MAEPSHLPTLVSMATFLLAVNLAYLRFETFEHRARIQKHASERLGDVTDVPAELKESDYYKRLSFWAGINRNRKAISGQLGWGGWYPLVFDAQRDRKASQFMICTALPVLLAGTAEASGQITILALAEWTGWILLALEIMTIGSVVLVLAGNAYISKACILIDKDAKQWKIFMRDRTPAAETGQVP